MRIQHNISALNAHRQLGINNSSVGKNLEKLSSGFRINRAGDDAAGLAISEKMRGQIRGLDMATRNANDGISLIQTAEGALNETHAILQRMRELAVQSSNGTYEAGFGGSDRSQLQKETQALKDEIDRIAKSTHFNNKKLLNGDISATGGAGAVGEASVTDNVAGSLAKAGTAAEYSFKINATAAIGDQIQIGDKTFVIYDDSVTGAVDPTGGDVIGLKNSIVSASAAALAKGIADAITTAGGTGGFTATQSGTTETLTFKAKDAGAGKDFTFRQWNSVGAAVTAGAGFHTKSVTVTGTDATSFVKSQNATSTFKIDVSKLQAGGKLSIGGLDFDIKTQAEFDKLSAADKKKTIIEGSTQADANATIAKALNESTSFKHKIANVGADGTFTFQAADGSYANGDAFHADLKVSYTAPAGAGGGFPTKGVTFQIGANGSADDRVNLVVGDQSTTALGINGIDISSDSGANAAIDLIDKATRDVSSTRADLGALQNRLEHTVANLGVSVENLTAAESRIRDVDMAKEMMEMTKNNILTQAAQAMLAQANTQPQSVLQLLQ